MGGCVSHDRNNRSHRRRQRRLHSSRSSATTSGTVGRNKPLNRSACRPRWKSDVAITENQLRRKREEYWDTAPAFDGRKEIWDALHGACYAIEQNDIDLAQSIVNCANISLPHGSLLDCYDELGTRYQLPVYILTPPINLVDGEQSSVDSRGDHESGTSDIGLAIAAATDRERDFGGNQSSSSSSSSTINPCRPASKSSTARHCGHNSIVREIKKHRRKQKLYTNTDSGNDSSSTNTTTPPSTVHQQSQQTNIDQDNEVSIKFRLSNGKEHRLYCKQNEKIRNIKRRLAMLENGAIDTQTQRLFFGGKLLRDRSMIQEARLQRNFVVQVILTDKPVSPSTAITTTDHLTTVADERNRSNSTAIELSNLKCSD